jgi:Family of unknown function (DUF5996)
MECVVAEPDRPVSLIDSKGWPRLNSGDWKDSYATLHRWTQIVGKIRMVNTPAVNHWWHAVLYVTARGLTTSPIPQGERSFQIDFDFIAHQLVVSTSDGDVRSMALAPRSVADFYGELTDLLQTLGILVRINTRPNELPDSTAFDLDHANASYDPLRVQDCWHALSHADRIFKTFRSGFVGKCSPSHFFWGSFDLAITRFSGRTAPMHPGGAPNCPDWVMHEAYSHELSSCGFWPGNAALPYPLFYAYAYPAPEGFASAAVAPHIARFEPAMQEFVLPYDEVRRAASPDALVLEFLQSTYEAAADRGNWDRAALERPHANG